MPRQLTTPDRVMLLIALVPYLSERGPTPVSVLAAHFDVEPETLRQLVRFLGMAGVPGETQSYQHEDLFDIDWEALEENDVVSLTQTVAVEETPRFSSAESAALVAGLHALLPILPPEHRAVAESAAQKLATLEPVDSRAPSVSVSPEPVDATLELISQALHEGVQVSFEYRDATGEATTRVVDPLWLFQAHAGWYLRAHCHARGADRSFALERIFEVRRLDTPVTRSALRPAVDGHARFDRSGLTATLRVHPAALHLIADFAPTVLESASDGWLRVQVELVHPAVAVRLVQVSPGELVFEEPVEVRAHVAMWADQALAQYDA